MARETFLLTPDMGDGITEYFHYDWDTGEEVIEHVQDATPILEEAQRRRNDTDERAKFGKLDFIHVGSIPLSLYYRIPEEIRMDQVELTKWFNKSENQIFFFKNGLRF
jgi:hypothetical protein